MATGKLASLLIKISADGASAERELRTLERKMKNTAKEFEKVGRTMSRYITAPLTALAGVSVAAANTQLQAEAKLLNALRGREDVQQRLIAQAGELQSRTTLGDEAIIEQQAYLAALGLSEKQIGDTIEAAAQLSTALNMDLGSAVRNLAKTYGGMTGKLGEGIPALRNLTKEQLQAGEAIKYVNDNYKGFAETAAQTGAGPLIQLKNTLGDIAEQFGVILLPALQKITEKLREFAQWLQDLSPEMRKIITIIGAVAAALGPGAVAFAKLVKHVKTLVQFLPLLKAALSSIMGPVGILTTAVSALALSWFNARRRMREYEEEAMALARAQGEADGKNKYQEDLARAVDFVRSRNYTDEALAKNIRDAMHMVAQLEAQGKDAYTTKVALNALLEVRNERQRDVAMINEEVDAMDNLNDATITQVGIIAELNAKISELEQSKTAAKSEAEIARINAELKKLREELERVDSLGEIKIATTIEKPKDMKDLALADNVDLTKIVPTGIALDMGSATLAANQMSAFWEDFAKKGERIRELIDNVASGIESSLESFFITTAEGLGNLFTGDEFHFVNSFIELLGKTLKMLGEALVTYAISMEAFKDSLSTIFLNPWGAIVAGSVAIITGQAFMNLAKKPIKLATGGLAYGPTLAVVGDNRGAASDPEVIAPLSKLRNYMGGQQMELVGGVAFELRGDVARAILNRENVRLNRKG